MPSFDVIQLVVLENAGATVERPERAQDLETEAIGAAYASHLQEKAEGAGQVVAVLTVTLRRGDGPAAVVGLLGSEGLQVAVKPASTFRYPEPVEGRLRVMPSHQLPQNPEVGLTQALEAGSVALSEELARAERAEARGGS